MSCACVCARVYVNRVQEYEKYEMPRFATGKKFDVLERMFAILLKRLNKDIHIYEVEFFLLYSFQHASSNDAAGA